MSAWRDPDDPIWLGTRGPNSSTCEGARAASPLQRLWSHGYNYRTGREELRRRCPMPDTPQPAPRNTTGDPGSVIEFPGTQDPGKTEVHLPLRQAARGVLRPEEGSPREEQPHQQGWREEAGSIPLRTIGVARPSHSRVARSRALRPSHPHFYSPIVSEGRFCDLRPEDLLC